jgi:hypothetical protein
VDASCSVNWESPRTSFGLVDWNNVSGMLRITRVFDVINRVVVTVASSPSSSPSSVVVVVTAVVTTRIFTIVVVIVVHADHPMHPWTSSTDVSHKPSSSSSPSEGR